MIALHKPGLLIYSTCSFCRLKVIMPASNNESAVMHTIFSQQRMYKAMYITDFLGNVIFASVGAFKPGISKNMELIVL